MCVKSNVFVLQYKHMQGFVSTKIMFRMWFILMIFAFCVEKLYFKANVIFLSLSNISHWDL
jgi:hypothetical protein